LVGLIGLPLAGCVQTEDPLHDAEGYLSPDTPLVLQMDGKSRVKLKNRWYDIYGRAATIQEFLNRKAQRYKLYFQESGQELPKVKSSGGKIIDGIPRVNVIIDAPPGTKAGVIFRLQRMIHNAGFINVMQKDNSPEGTQP
jgi:hypothetical protein